MYEKTRKTAANGQAGIQARIYSGTAVVLLGAVLLGWVATAGEVKVNAGAISAARARLDRHEVLAERCAGDISEIKADLSAIKVMLGRIEKELEDKE